MPHPPVSFLLTIIDQAFDHKSWHGANLAGSIRGLHAPAAAWSPGPERHSIWDIVLHAAYWKYVVRRRLTGEARGSFPREGSNWFDRRRSTDEADWKQDVALLKDTHHTLRDAIARLKPSHLDDQPDGSKVTNLDLLTGIAAHDLYHAGQIQLLKRLHRDAHSIR
jgi:uncharacterized damage-inducible protein DinB